MHSTQEQTTFMLLRANGWSLGKISEKLNISKSTLYHWDCQHRGAIHTVKCMQVEKLQEKYIPSYEEELQHLAAYLARIEHALQQQCFERMRPEFLLKTALNLRARFNKLRTDVPAAIPGDQSRLAPIPVRGCLSRAEKHVLAADYKPIDSTAWLSSPSPAQTEAPPAAGQRPTVLSLPKEEDSAQTTPPIQAGQNVGSKETALFDDPNEQLCLTAASNEPINRHIPNGSPPPKCDQQNGTFWHENKNLPESDASSSEPCNLQNGTTVPLSVAPS